MSRGLGDVYKRQLQDFVHAEGRKHGRSLEAKRVLGQDDFGGDVLYDGDRCIMCTRCVRFMREIAGNDVLGVVQRGNKSVIDTFFDQGLDNDLWAGNIVDICPVGALLSKDFLHKARAWDLDGAPSICASCSQGCNIRIDTRDNLAQRLKPRLNSDVNSYWMCDYGRFRYEWLNRGDRIEAPLVRDAAGKLAATGWSQAINALLAQAEATGASKHDALVVASPYHATEDAGLAARVAAVIGGSVQLVYRSPMAASEEVCPGFTKLARRRELSANGRGLGIMGYSRVGDDAGTGGLTNGAKVLIVIGDELGDLPENFGADAELFIYIGHTLTAAARNAHFVLPGTTYGEMEGTFVNFEGRVQRFWPALQPPPLARPAWQILGVLLAGLGDADAPASAGSAFIRLGELHDAFAGLNYDMLGSRGALINDRVQIGAGGAEVR